jgi:FkbM family methyltransferase
MDDLQSYQLFLDNAGMVYDHLADEQSKEIMIDMISYNISLDTEIFNKKRISTQIKNESLHKRSPWYNPDFSIYMNYEPRKLDGKRVVIVSAGFGCEQLLSKLQAAGCHCLAFCDKDNAKQADEFLRKPVISYNQLSELLATNSDVCVIISSYKYFAEIRETLNGLGIGDEIISPPPPGYIDISQFSDQYFDSQIIKFTDDEIFVDVGCCDFSDSVNLLSKCRTVKQIYAIEPDPENIRIIENNMTKCGFTQVEIVNKPLSDVSGKVNFIAKGGAGGYVVGDNGKSSEGNCEAVALDDVIPSGGGGGATFIKMDI